MSGPLLLLAGTSEARALAARLAAAGIPVVASLSGATRDPARLDVPTRIGGFGGAGPFRSYLDTAGIAAVLDATHPFARRIGPRTAAVCSATSRPYLRLLRPPWMPGPGDDWRDAADESAAAAMVPRGAAVFLATGAQRLGAFAALPAGRVILRVADRPEGATLLPGAEVVTGPPGRTAAEEAALFEARGVTMLVARNSGGPARAKLDAARALGLPAVMIRRPPPPEAPMVSTVAAALDWALDRAPGRALGRAPSRERRPG